MSFSSTPFLSVGDIFQHVVHVDSSYNEVSCIFLVIRVIQRFPLNSERLNIVESTTNSVVFEFVCINTRTYKQSHEFQFSYDIKIPPYYRILSR